ncbi:MAG: Zn-dependent protease with chaperone function [Maribacter sp.]|jgi:Zn-dependent protease with chaperone function
MVTKNIYLPFALFLLFSFSLTAQNLNNFEQLVSDGEIPKEFISSSSSKYKSLEKKVKDKKKAGKKQKKFYLESSFAIDQLLRSGEVLFGDPVSDYVNKVADKLLEHSPKLRKKLRFYVVKSAGVNAFATDRGSIFVNLGLMSRLENEAQFAFVLAHEIIHYKHRHNMDSFLEYQEIEAGFKRQKSCVISCIVYLFLIP